MGRPFFISVIGWIRNILSGQISGIDRYGQISGIRPSCLTGYPVHLYFDPVCNRILLFILIISIESITHYLKEILIFPKFANKSDENPQTKKYFFFLKPGRGEDQRLEEITLIKNLLSEIFRYRIS